MPTTIHAVIFDLDGTLLDTLDDLANAANRVLAKRGFPTHSAADYCHFVGDGVGTLMARILPPENRDESTLRQCIHEMKEDYAQNWNVATKPYAGISEMLDGLHAQGLKLAVLSNKPQVFTDLCVNHQLPPGLFEAVLGQREGVPVKPDPAGALEITRTLGVDPAACLYVGDTGTDMHTAVAAGMFPVGVLWGFRDEQELRDTGAKAIVGAPDEIASLTE